MRSHGSGSCRRRGFARRAGSSSSASRSSPPSPRRAATSSARSSSSRRCTSCSSSRSWRSAGAGGDTARPVTTQQAPAGGPLPTRGRATPAPTEADAELPPASREGQHVVILSGLSGGGKTAAAKLFEDLGYTVVDNLPGELLIELAELVSDEPDRFDKVAIVLDVRSGDAPMAFGAMRGALEGRG